MFHVKNSVMKIMSKSPSPHLVRLQGKLKLPEIYIYKFYYICLNIPTPISVADFKLPRKSRKSFEKIVFTKYVFFKFSFFLGGGGCSPEPPPPVWVRQ